MKIIINALRLSIYEAVSAFLPDIRQSIHQCVDMFDGVQIQNNMRGFYTLSRQKKEARMTR